MIQLRVDTKEASMIIHHSCEEWPEAMGTLVKCSECKTEHPAIDCLSIMFNHQVGEIIQVKLFLICTTCVTAKVSLGRC